MTRKKRYISYGWGGIVKDFGGDLGAASKYAAKHHKHVDEDRGKKGIFNIFDFR